MYKTCVFDLDGTLADTLNSIEYYANLALEHFGLNTIPTNEYKYLAGNGAGILVQRMLRYVGGDENYAESVLKYYKKIYDDNFLYKTQPYDGICELLTALKEQGLKLAVLSNKPHQTAVKVVNALFGENIFTVCRGLSEGWPAKPSKAALDIILKETNTNTKECIYIGDTKVDMETGKNAGVFTIGVSWGFHIIEDLIAAGADLIINSPHELLEFICSQH